MSTTNLTCFGVAWLFLHVYYSSEQGSGMLGYSSLVPCDTSDIGKRFLSPSCRINVCSADPSMCVYAKITLCPTAILCVRPALYPSLNAMTITLVLSYFFYAMTFNVINPLGLNKLRPPYTLQKSWPNPVLARSDNYLMCIRASPDG